MNDPSVMRAVRLFVQAESAPVTPRQTALALRISDGTSKWALSVLAAEGTIVRVARGRYAMDGSTAASSAAAAMVTVSMTMTPEAYDEMLLVTEVLGITQTAYLREAVMRHLRSTLASKVYQRKVQDRIVELQTSIARLHRKGKS